MDPKSPGQHWQDPVAQKGTPPAGRGPAYGDGHTLLSFRRREPTMATATAVTEVVQRTDAPVRRHGLVLAVIVACQLMLMLDTTVMNVVLPRIQAQLRFSPVGLSWVMSAYTLVYGGLLLLGGRAGDLLGRRRVFIAGVAVFTAASLAGGLSGSPAWLILARA